MNPLVSDQNREVAGYNALPGRMSGDSVTSGVTAETVAANAAASQQARRYAEDAAPAAETKTTIVEKVSTALAKDPTKKWYQRPGVWIGIGVAVVGLGVLAWKMKWLK
jgi:succinate dehydrogenase/fumarate reductase flavoprotein subunit